MGILLGLMLGLGLVSVWLTGPLNSTSTQTLNPPGVDPTLGKSGEGTPGWFGRRTQMAVGFAVGCGFIGMLATGLLVVGLLAAGLGSCIPRLLSNRRHNREAQRRRQAWPDVIDGLVSAVRAGMSLPEAVAAVGDRGPVVVRPVFAQFAADYRATGRFGDCLNRLRNELKDPVADRIVEALLTARDVGGSDLGRMLRTLSDFVRQDLRLRGEAEARRSWTVNGARLAIAAPWLVLVMLSTRPEAASAYQTAAGVFVLLACALACALAYALMTKLGRLPEEQRVML